jgi:hypothetical protein
VRGSLLVMLGLDPGIHQVKRWIKARPYLLYPLYTLALHGSACDDCLSAPGELEGE